MRCRKIISYLHAYADGELTEKRRLAVKVHLAACESCRGRLEEIRGIGVRLQGTLPVPPVPDGLAVQIMAEARKRQPTGTPERPLPLPAWNPLEWIAELSAPMRIAACVTFLLALVAGLSLDGRGVTGRDVHIEPGRNLSGLEWFDSAPPGSIASIYVAMADEEDGKGKRE